MAAAPSVIAPDKHLDGRLVETFGVPADMITTTWWDADSNGNPKPKPGDPGMAIILGHTQIGGYGVFNDLGTLKPGDDVFILDDATTKHFRVIGDPISGIPKEDGDALKTALENHPANAGLALLTCSGDFDSSIRESDENTVVFLELVSE